MTTVLAITTTTITIQGFRVCSFGFLVFYSIVGLCSIKRLQIYFHTQKENKKPEIIY